MIVNFWDNLITQWKAENKCGLCWADFEAPLVESASNIVQLKEGDQCCVLPLLTNIRETETVSYSPTTFFEIRVNQDQAFDIHFVTQGDLGTNNYTEIKGHPKEESRWATIYKPIKDCLNRLDIQRELCVYTGLKIDITLWELTPARQAYLDNNYFGWKLKVNFRITK